MTTRLQNFFKFQLERFILRGTLYRLLFIAATIVLVSVGGGLLVFWATTGFSTSGEAMWWAFLRLTDPGYLGDDEGQVKRVISTVLTVLGYVLFMGALIAIMTQWLHETITGLQSGLTPIFKKNHFLILGWSDRTPAMVHRLLRSEGRVRRYLNNLGERKLHIVILAEEVDPSLMQALRDELGPLYNPNQITFRSGNPLKMEHLRRVDFLRAASIMLPAEPGSDSGSASPDGRAVKILLSATHCHPDIHPASLPLVVVEIQNSRNAGIAEHVYGGPIETLVSETILSRTIAQIVRHPGLSWVLGNFILPDGPNQVFVREFPGLAGTRFDQAVFSFEQAILLGVTQKSSAGSIPIINPPEIFTLSSEDRLVFLAPSFQDTEPTPRPAGRTAPSAPAHPPASEEHTAAVTPSPPPRRRVLVLGWNLKASGLIRELDSYGNESFELEMISMLPIAEREAQLRRQGIAPQRLQVTHHIADYTSQPDLARFRPETFDNIVILANDRLDSDAESEARLTLGYLVLQEILAGAPVRPHIVVELMSRENLSLFQDRGDEVIITPLLLSNILTQVALRRDLNCVFELLFGSDGPEFIFRPCSELGVSGSPVSFASLQQLCLAQQEIALGFRRADQRHLPGGGITLNPDRHTLLDLSTEDEIVVITR